MVVPWKPSSAAYYLVTNCTATQHLGDSFSVPQNPLPGTKPVRISRQPRVQAFDQFLICGMGENSISLLPHLLQ